MKIYYKIMLLMLILSLIFSINVQGDTEEDHGIAPASTTDTVKEWVFGDEEFDDLLGTLKSDVEINGLVLHKGLSFRNLTKDIKNKKYTRCLDINERSVIDEDYISIPLDGPSNVYFVAQTNQVNNARDLKLNVDTNKVDYISVNEAKGYCYKYRGTGGTIEVRSVNSDIRIYAIAVVKFDAKKYEYLNSYPNREWDLSQITQDERLTENRDIDGLTVLREAVLIINEHTNKYGFRYYRAIGLPFEGTDESIAICLDVQTNTDIYITARSTGSVVRPLRITDKYGCDIETENNIQTFDVTNDADTYKLSYKGEADTLYIYSDNGGIRIYQIAAIKQSDKITDEIDCCFKNHADVITGQSMNGRTIGGVSFINGMAAASTDTAYGKAVQIKGNRFALADKMSFNIAASKGKKIKVSARNISSSPSKLIVANKYGYIVGSYDLSDVTQEYEFEYLGAYDTFYLYATAGKAEIFDISTMKSASPVTRNVYVIKGRSYRYSFTVENASVNTRYKYIIEYDPTKLKFIHIGKDNNFTGGLTDKSIGNVVNTSGKITFNLVGDEVSNWSGIATSVLFEGVADGSTSIKFSAERR